MRALRSGAARPVGLRHDRALWRLTVPSGGVPGDPLGAVTVSPPVCGKGDVRHDGGTIRHLHAPSLRRHGEPRGRDVASLMEEIASYLRRQPVVPAVGPGGGGRDPSSVRIVLPYSGSEGARRSIETAARVAALMSAEVRVVHVRCYEMCRGARFYVRTKEEAARLGLDAVCRLRRHGVAATAVIRNAPRWAVADAIVREACESRVSAIVLCARRHSALVDFVRPGLLRRVLRDAPCPVVVVRAGPSRRADSGRGGERSGRSTKAA